MSLPDLSRRAVLTGLTGLGLAALFGCTLAPVHSDPGGGERDLNLRFAEPGNRNAQLFYRALSARVTPSTDFAAPILHVDVSTSATRVGDADISSPVANRRIIARARYRVVDGNTVVLEGERSAMGQYRTSGQILANDAARDAAQEDAIRTVAENVRLALYAALAP